MHWFFATSLDSRAQQWRRLKNLKMFLWKIFIVVLGISCVSSLRCYFCDSRNDTNCDVINADTRSTQCADMRVPAHLECLEMQFREVCKFFRSHKCEMGNVLGKFWIISVYKKGETKTLAYIELGCLSDSKFLDF